MNRTIFCRMVGRGSSPFTPFGRNDRSVPKLQEEGNEGGQSLLCPKMHEKDYSSGMYEVMADRNESY